MLAQRWANCASPTNIDHMFYFCWPNVGSTLLHQQTLSRNSWHGKMLAQRWANCALPTNRDHMFYLCWPDVVMPTKQSMCYERCVIMLAQRWANIVCPTPTIDQRYNQLPTLAQRSHAIWVKISTTSQRNAF